MTALAFGSRLSVDPARLELVKWVAFLAMLVEHVGRYAFDAGPWIGWVGSFALPAFGLAFGAGLVASRAPHRSLYALVVPAVLAQVAWEWLTPGRMPNILLALGLGGVAVVALVRVGWQESALLALAVAWLCQGRIEGGFLGPAFVYSGALVALYGRSWHALPVGLAGSVLVFLPGAALAGAAVAFSRAWPLLPRLPRGSLAWGYVAHLVLLAAFVSTR